MKELIHSILACFGIITVICLVWYTIYPEIEPNCFFSILVGVVALFIENWLNPNS